VGYHLKIRCPTDWLETYVTMSVDMPTPADVQTTTPEETEQLTIYRHPNHDLPIVLRRDPK